jgi:hypothetical protein
MRLNTLIRRIERVRDEVVPAVRAACEKEAAWIVSANREQLAEGLNAEGVLMNGGVYSPTSVRQRAKRGLPVDHVYLSFEGDMQAAMQVEYSETGFSVVTTDWKQRLVDEAMRTGYWPSSGYDAPEYGPVFGLTAEKRGELARRIMPKVARAVRRRIVG